MNNAIDFENIRSNRLSISKTTGAGLSVLVIFLIAFFIATKLNFRSSDFETSTENSSTNTILPASSPSPAVNLIKPPQSKILPTTYHVFQTFNNCGPASLSMALRFYGITVSQEDFGQALRPYQVESGDNDDKSVTLDELAEKSKEYGFVPYHRPMGSPDLVKQFIALNIPVIARTVTKPNEDIGHYRIIKGYDDVGGIFIQDDSLQNKNLEYTYADFNEIWKKFNYEYLVLVPKDKVQLIDQILGENADVKTAWQNAVKNSERELSQNSDDIYSRFNLSVALYNVGDYQRSVEEFEKVENLLPFRTLWYQIEPILSYFELENYQRVFSITDKVLNNDNRAFSELYLIRGKIYLKQGNKEMAKQEFEKAVFYNKNFKDAQQELSSLT